MGTVGTTTRFTGEQDRAAIEEAKLKARGFSLVDKPEKALGPLEYTKYFHGSDPHSFGGSVHTRLTWLEP